MQSRPELTPDELITRRAQEACARAASCPADLRQLLSMLALWPGQEHLRTYSPGNPQFNPRDKW